MNLEQEMNYMEFEKKIKRAKADILSLKDKLRIIDRG